MVEKRKRKRKRLRKRKKERGKRETPFDICTVCDNRERCADMVETISLENLKKIEKMWNGVSNKAKKEGLSNEWIDYVFDNIFTHFILPNPKSFSFKCEKCLDFISDVCKGGNFPDCFIKEAKNAKELGFTPTDLLKKRLLKK